MSRHDRDVLSLMTGLLLVLVAALFLVVDATDLSVQARWVAPALLLVVGGVGLAATLRARTGDDPVLPEPDGS